MLMRRFRKRLLKDFLPTIKVTKPEKRHSAIYKFLQESFQIQRREMVTDYRNYVADESRSCWHRFDITPYLLRAPRAEHPLVNRTNCPSIFYLIRREESVVFQIPGWESWDVREVVRLRAEEEMSTLNLMQCENVINSAARRREQNLRERWDKMLGKKEANEKTLEGYLKERVKW
ncbi:hypothetical protein EJ02DRAFT_450109 [Clathrospora elynae]|uniref:Uncharacterized protein n=1 Tax=Clathrospora elynae TaxID=706981 RepID=A0A6A5T8R3_9PLEO|nr:hypothetical protein EJ02DRAFT_450109 [Clathrospora elynae]